MPQVGQLLEGGEQPAEVVGAPGVVAGQGIGVDRFAGLDPADDLIDEVGKDPGPGQAVLFGTTSLFLERLGVDGLHELPALAEFVPGGDVVEQLEAGLRPEPGPTLSERLDELESTGPRTLPSLDDEE